MPKNSQLKRKSPQTLPMRIMLILRVQIFRLTFKIISVQLVRVMEQVKIYSLVRRLLAEV